MQLCKVRNASGSIEVGVWESSQVRLLDLSGMPGPKTLSSILHAPDAAGLVRLLPVRATVPADQVKLLPPLDEQEVWAAGVTYKRSKVAREEESAGTGALALL